ncbi:MAG: dihydrolipoyl dehydrogenase [Acidobacteriota bacterium]|nr:dihydrolipoyl dehydrogenase [Acidobacteriota bacterium]
MVEKKDLVIIGGGPGGYLAALRAAQLKKKVVVFEEDRIGGTCINYGCIPTKYLLHQTKVFKDLKTGKKLRGPLAEIGLDWAAVQAGRAEVAGRLAKNLEFLLQKNKVEIVKGTARLKNERQAAVVVGGEERLYEGGSVILASGSRSASLPFLQPDGRVVVTSREALEFDEIPRSLLVVGAGAIGLEMGSIYHRLGTDVTVLEIMPTVMPGSDKETASRLERTLKKQGLKIFTQMRIEEARVAGGKAVLQGTCLKNQVPFSYEGDKVLLAAGRRPNSENLAEDDSLLALGKGGIVQVNDFLETSAPGVYAIGDLIGGKLLAHKAYHDAVCAAENAAGLRRRVDYTALPMAVFTEPEFASVGLTEEEALSAGVKVQSGTFPLQASGRAMTMDSTDGLVKVLADGNDRVIGGHILAPAASEIIGELALAVSKGMKIQDIASVIHIHPTFSEAVVEAALKVKNEALHLLNQ